MLDEKFIELLQSAKEKDIINSGTLLIIKDYVHECRNKIKKNEQQIERMKGQNDQLSLVVGTLGSIVNKYIRFQEEADREAKEKQEKFKDQEVKEEKTVKASSPSIKAEYTEVKSKPKKNR